MSPLDFRSLVRLVTLRRPTSFGTPRPRAPCYPSGAVIITAYSFPPLPPWSSKFICILFLLPIRGHNGNPYIFPRLNSTHCWLEARKTIVAKGNESPPVPTGTDTCRCGVLWLPGPVSNQNRFGCQTQEPRSVWGTP